MLGVHTFLTFRNSSPDTDTTMTRRAGPNRSARQAAQRDKANIEKGEPTRADVKKARKEAGLPKRATEGAASMDTGDQDVASEQDERPESSHMTGYKTRTISIQGSQPATTAAYKPRPGRDFNTPPDPKMKIGKSRQNSSGKWMYDGIELDMSIIESRFTATTLSTIPSTAATDYGNSDEVRISETEILSADYVANGDSSPLLLVEPRKNKKKEDRRYLEVRTRDGHPNDLCLSVRQSVLSLLDIDLNSAGLSFSLTMYEGRYRIEVILREKERVSRIIFPFVLALPKFCPSPVMLS